MLNSRQIRQGAFNEKVLRGRGVRLLEVLQAGERRSERDGCEDHRGQASRFHRGKSRWSDAEIEGIGRCFAQIENIIRQSLFRDCREMPKKFSTFLTS